MLIGSSLDPSPIEPKGRRDHCGSPIIEHFQPLEQLYGIQMHVDGLGNLRPGTGTLEPTVIIKGAQAKAEQRPS